MAETWQLGSVAIVGTNKIRSLRDYVKDHVDMFLIDYLKANSKN